MRFWLLLFTFHLFFCKTFSQEVNKKNIGDYTITGIVLDAFTQSPIEYATVTLWESSSGKIVNGTVTNEKGVFGISGVTVGTYLVIIDFLSYSADTIPITFSSGSLSIFNLDKVFLTSRSIDLNAVTITSRQDLIENKVDKLVYHVDKDITSQGGMATDVLRKIPQVTVDINGNVELLGNPSVRFLIDGKPSAIFGSSIADALQSIPASQIERIEVISSPGAKYDATGTGGIINILMKKNKAEGFSGTTNFTLGTRQENGALNLNFKRNNLAITGYFSGSAQLTSNTINETNRNSTDPVTLNTFDLMQTGTSEFNRNGYRSGLGMDWDVSPKDNLRLAFNQFHFGTNSQGIAHQVNIQQTKDKQILFDQYSLRNVDNHFNNYTYEASADYGRKLKKEKQEFSLTYHLSIGDNTTSYQQSSRYPINDSVFQGSHSSNPGKDYIHSFTFDYSEPVTKSFLLEAGAKAEIETLISNSDVFTFSRDSYDYYFDNKQSYTSRFTRQVYAGYASGNFAFFKQINVIAGIRYEHTLNQTRYSKEAIKIPDYNNLGPALTLSHTFGNQQVLKFSYAYRLERPEYRDLNPFVNLADPHNINTGNPLILPEIGNDFQLGFNQSYGQDNNLNIVLVYTYNSPDIKSYTTFYPAFTVGDSVYTNVNVSRRDNIAAETRWGVSLFNTFNAIRNMSIRANIQLYDRTTKDNRTATVSISGFEYRGNLNVNFHFPHDVIAEAFGNYNSGIHWQGTRPAFYSYTVALRKQIANGKGSIGLSAVNAFGKYLTQHSIQEGTGFTGSTLLKVPYRSLGLTFNYKFGKIRISKPREGEDYLTKPPVEN